jgi:hypothetical protein
LTVRTGIFFLSLLLSGPVFAEPGDLTVRITPEVVEADQTVSWEQALSKDCRPGTPVVVNIDAEGLAIRITVTPFVQGDSYLLVVQGEVRQKKVTGVRGSSSVQSLLVPSGEPIAYFPLGRSPTADVRQMVVLIRVEAAGD